MNPEVAIWYEDGLGGGKVVTFDWAMGIVSPCPKGARREAFDGIAPEGESMGRRIGSRPGGDVGW